MSKSSLVVLLSRTFISLLLPLTAAQYCSYPGNFTSSSTYGTNRDRIVSSLMQNVHDNLGFYNATLGQGSDTVYALGLCRGDLSNITCMYCISKASLDIFVQCPNKIEAIAYGDPYPCIIRYSNKSFSGAMDSRPAKFLHGASNITDHIDEFDQALNDLIDNLIIRTAAGNASLKFAMGTTNYIQDENNTVYGLMQCVPSLSSVDCSRCLRGAVDDYRSCCLKKKAVNIMRPSCLFQYDLSPISESSAGAAPPTPAPPPAHTFAPPTPSTNVTTKQDNKSSMLWPTIVIVMVAVSISLVLTALACVLLRLRTRKDVKHGKLGRKEQLQIS
ncbi:cysteine-rich receptor-like protein kinase 11 isoform X1 [Rhododendron vialii]|uniref:cysteine-rich receptor-like protein kinase 11 isoform X1 n=1 Tax=Rhododendron vialii TaxID=182163 RepID=UPI00265DF3B1|nr:cysteine-rich receptor-like protein kinase 11 isoform X1 [Rhododendron vialii]